MRIVTFIIAIFFINFSFMTNKTKVKISPKSEIIIKGKSNVNSFECNYNSSYLVDEIAVELIKEQTKTIIDGAKINVVTNGFNCGNKMITKDFKTILKAGEYNHIKIDLKELVENKSNYTATIDVTIAGIKKQYSLPVSYNQNDYNVRGKLKLDIKDFKLQSPKKLLGMIKVNDIVEIEFMLFLQF